MKQLLILRHAQALGTEVGGTDKTRSLSPRGIEDAKALGAVMHKAKLIPDLVLCSTAKRTRQTLENVLDTLNDNSKAMPVDYSDALYNADFGSLLSAIQATGPAINTLLIVAHNPGVHTLAARLAADDGSSHVDRLSTHYAPATLSVLSCGIHGWDEIQLYSNPVKAVYETVDYNEPERPTRWM